MAAGGQAHVTPQDFHRARELLQQAAAAGTETAMVFNYRFFDQVQLARRLRAERELGAPMTGSDSG